MQLKNWNLSNNMLHTIRQVKVVQDYQLQLHFDTGGVRVADLEPLLRKSANLIQELLDPEMFNKVECDGTTIHWPNGVDFCPDVLYRLSKPMSRNRFKTSKSAPRVKKRILRSRT
jgi:hypothetical protein